MEKIMGKILTGALIVALTSTIFNSEVKADISEQTVPAVGVVADSKKTEELKYEEKNDDYNNFNLIGIKINGKWGFVNKKGEETVPLKYDAANFFIKDLATVRKENKWGAVNKEGKEVIPFKYEHINDFYYGYSIVSIGGKWGSIDTKGKVLADIKYDNWFDFDDGLAAVRENNKWGLINEKGKEIISLKYDYLSNVRIGKADKNGYVKVKVHAVSGKKEGDIEYRALRKISKDSVSYLEWKLVKDLK